MIREADPADKRYHVNVTRVTSGGDVYISGSLIRHYHRFVYALSKREAERIAVSEILALSSSKHAGSTDYHDQWTFVTTVQPGRERSVEQRLENVRQNANPNSKHLR